MIRLISTALVLVTWPASAAAATWRDPQTVQQLERSQFVPDPQVGIDDAGNATVLWTRTQEGVVKPGASQMPRARHAVFTVDVAPDGTAGRVQRLSPPGKTVYNARMAVAADGHAAVAWTQGPQRGLHAHRSRTVQVLTRPPAGDWSAPRTISEPGSNYAGDVVIEPDGTVAVAWSTLRAGGGDVVLRRFAPDGAVLSDERPGRGTRPRLAASPSFPHAVMTFLRGKSPISRDTILYADGRETVIGAETYWTPEVAAGDAIAVAWSQSSPPPTGPVAPPPAEQSSDLTVITSAGAADRIRLSDPDPDVVSLEPAVDARGSRVIAAARYFDTVRREEDIRVYRPSHPAEDPTSGPGGGAPNVALGDRRAVAVWTVSGQGGPVNAAVADGDAPFSAQERISRAGERYEPSYRPPVAMNANGAAVVAYLAQNGTQGPPHLSVTTLRR